MKQRDPDELARAEYVDGVASHAEAEAMEAAAGSDPELREELEVQGRIDRALGCLLGRAGGDARAVDAVMRRVASAGVAGSAHREAVVAAGGVGRSAGGRHGAGGATLLRIAALLVASLGAGITGGWLWSSVSGAGGGAAGTGSAPGAGGVEGRPGAGRLGDFLARVDAAGPDTIEAVFLQVEAGLHGAERASALIHAIDRWAALDPLGALAFLERRPGAEGDLESLFVAWARVDAGAAWENLLPVLLADPPDALLDATTAETIEQALLKVEAGAPGAGREAAVDLVIYRWAEIDPAGALAFLAQREAPGAAVDALFSAWARIDPEAAWAAVPSLPTTGLRDAAARRVLTWLSGSDPRRFIELAGADASADRNSWRRAFETMTSQGGEVDDFLLELTDTQRDSAIAGMADSLAAQDPQAALDWASRLSGDDRRAALVAVIEPLAESDPRAAGAMLRSLPDRFPRLERRIVRQMADNDPPGALDWIRDYPPEEARGELYRELGSALAKNGGQEVFAVYDELLATEGPGALWGDDWFQKTIWSSSGLDYRSGIEWVQSLPPEVRISRSAAQRGMIFSWAKLDMAGTLDYIAHVENDNWRNSFYGAVVHHMLSMNHPIENAWDLARSLPEGAPQRGRAMVDVVMYESRFNPAVAAGRVADLPEGADHRRVIERIASNWGAQAPREAVQWAADLETPTLRDAAIEKIASSWSYHDTLRASAWIDTLEPGGARDRAVEQLVRNVAPLEADSAFLWAVTIDDPDRRQRANDMTVQAWAQQDAAGARAAIEASSLPPEERGRLLGALLPLSADPQPAPAPLSQP